MAKPPTIERKLSSRIIMGNTMNALALNGQKSRDLYVVGGIAKGIRQGESDNGPWVAFRGEFFAKNIETEEQFQAAQCFLPEPLQGLVLGQLGSTDESGRPIGDDGKPTGAKVEFVSIVSIEEDKDSALGFRYNARPVLEVKPSDALTGLMERVAVTEPNLLPAPKKSRGKRSENAE